MRELLTVMRAIQSARSLKYGCGSGSNSSVWAAFGYSISVLCWRRRCVRRNRARAAVVDDAIAPGQHQQQRHVKKRRGLPGESRKRRSSRANRHVTSRSVSGSWAMNSRHVGCR